MRTRFPFQYGIASLTAIPHLFVKASVEINGTVMAVGLTSEGLPPKWFTKDPDTRFEEDLPLFFEVIQFAAKTATEAPASSFFDLWRLLHEAQNANLWSHGVAPLLANLGVALMERAILDAICRGTSQTIQQLLLRNPLGVDLGSIRNELKDFPLRLAIKEQPVRHVYVRHTIGFADPLDEGDISEGESLDDGLPYSLAENIQKYGLRYFKIKVRGNKEIDLHRLSRIIKVLEECRISKPEFTLDGNESFQSLEEFQDFYNACMSEMRIRKFFEDGLLFIEQPLHRNVALKEDLNNWINRPPIVLDESDADLSSLPTALALGYEGCSHKNCKGIIKSLANAALLKHKSLLTPEATWLLSGEDLANVGPVALNQDLAMVACLGITHVERNGHHYFKGLSMFPSKMWDLIGEPDLYHTHEGGFPTLRIEHGCLDLASVNKAPFGTSVLIDSTQFTPLEQWSVESLQ